MGGPILGGAILAMMVGLVLWDWQRQIEKKKKEKQQRSEHEELVDEVRRLREEVAKKDKE